MPGPTNTSRHFPHTAWAWPSGALDQLLCAAICPDAATGRQAFFDWLDCHDIDSAGFREHRLLASISERYGKDLAARPEHARLVGLQRHLWTRSRMAMAEALPVLRALADAGIAMLLLKGGARIAAHAGDQRARVAHDLDILVPPDDFARALDVLFDAGWNASSGESRLCLKAQAGSLRAMNFFGQRFGDIDLHQWAYGAQSPRQAALEAMLWQNARPAVFFGVPVRIPSPTDRLALAICHSGLDAHAHSDWLVDCAQLIGEGEIDGEALLAALGTMQAVVPAQVALGYLAQRLGVALPAPFLMRLLADRGAGPLRRLSDLLQAKPRSAWGVLSWLARGLAKQRRLALARKARSAPVPLKGRFHAAGCAPVSATPSTNARLLDLSALGAGGLRFRLELLVTMPGPPRRLEFELNTEMQHLKRLSLRSLRRRHGPTRLSFDGVIELPEGQFGLWLEARPGRHLRGTEPAAKAARYGALAFTVLSFQCAPVSGAPPLRNAG